MSSFFSNCSRVLSSIKPDKNLMMDCLDNGEELNFINCKKVLEEGSITNGYMFTKCIEKRKFQLMRFVNPPGHNGFKYVHGNNVDILPFNPFGNCNPGGLYFAHQHNVLSFSGHGPKLCKVTVPPHARVYVERDKFKASEIDVDLDNAMTVEQYVGSLTKKQLLDMTDHILFVKYANSINPDILDAELIEILLRYSPHVVVYKGTTKKAIKKYLASCSFDDIKSLLHKCGPNTSIISYIPLPMLTEENCQDLCRELMSPYFEDTTQLNLRYSLALRIKKITHSQKNTYSRQFLIHLINNFKMDFIILPDEFITKETLDAFLKVKTRMNDLIDSGRFASVIKSDSCHYWYYRENIISLGMKDKCEMDIMCYHYYLPKK